MLHSVSPALKLPQLSMNSIHSRYSGYCRTASVSFGSQPAAYTYSDGEASRLSDQGKIMHQDSMALVRRAGLQTGDRVLDMGCGTGDMTFALAQAVGPTGIVVGIDYNPERVTANAQALADLPEGTGESNITFIQGNAEQFTTDTPFDMAYSRFMLAHLSNPGDAIARLVEATKPGGRVVIEDVDIRSMKATSSYVKPVETLKTWLIAAVDANGGNAEIGPELSEMVQEHPDIARITASDHQPHSTEGPVKSVPINVLTGIKADLIKKGIATAKAIAGVEAQLQALAEDDSAEVYFPKIYQVIGYKA